MPPEQVQAFYAHVWPIFWPVLWWNLIVYRAWRDEMWARGYGDMAIAVTWWGQIIVEYMEPPRPDVPDYQGLSQRCAAHIGRLSPDVGCIEGAARYAPAVFAKRADGAFRSAQCTLPVPILDSS